jgi:hypothetical protein
MNFLAIVMGLTTIIPTYGTYKHFITIPFLGKEHIEAEIINNKILVRLSGLVNLDGYAEYVIKNDKLTITISKNIDDFLTSKLSDIKILKYDKDKDEVLIQIIIGKIYKKNITLYNAINL